MPASSVMQTLYVLLFFGCCGQVISQATESEVDTEYTAYGNWTECTVTCGGGLSFRTRECLDLSGDSECEKAEQRRCNEQPCAAEEIDAEYTVYGNWSECTVTCGGGLSFQTKECVDLSGDPGCEKAEQRRCNEQPCELVEPASLEEIEEQDSNETEEESKRGFLENITEGLVEGRQIPSREDILSITSTTGISSTVTTEVAVTTTPRKPAKTIAAEACKVEIKTSKAAKKFNPQDFNRDGEYSCEWIIKADKGKRVMAQVTYNNQKSCCDEFEVYDGRTLLARVTGADSFKRTYVTRSDTLRITFTSRGVEGLRNFAVLHAQYTAPTTTQTQRPPTTTTKAETAPALPMGKCGDELQATEEIQKFDSKIFVKNTKYDCVWTITAPKGSHVKVLVKYFNTARCCSALEFYDKARIFKKYRGTIYVAGDHLVTKSNRLMVLYRNPSVNGYSKVTLLYRAVKDGEDAPIEETSITPTLPIIRTTTAATRAFIQTTKTPPKKAKIQPKPHQARRCEYRAMATHYVRRLKSPLYSRGHGCDCTWHITAYHGQRVQVRLYYYNTAMRGDMLEVKDGNEVIDSIHSNTYSQKKYTTKRSTLSLRLISEGYPGVRRFYVYYQAVPGTLPAAPHAHRMPIPHHRSNW